jgi:hypothetical protein
MAEYVVEEHDHCSSCGSDALIVYRQQRDDCGRVILRIPHDVTCSNPRCAYWPPAVRRPPSARAAGVS